ncbi:MAG: ABC transporter permease [Anaerolineales bacterium]|nr:ABC transporter permease [Anaerolineales bacterium]
MKALRRALGEFGRYPSAIAGVVIIGLLILVSIYTLLALPLPEAIAKWRGGEEYWAEYPKTAAPVWVNWFRARKLPPTLVESTADGSATKTSEALTEEMTDIQMVFDVNYTYDAFPQELSLFITTNYTSKPPLLSVTWLTPDGREIRVGEFTPRHSDVYRFSIDDKLIRRLGGIPPEQGLFIREDPSGLVLVKGNYQLLVSAVTFEPGSDVDAKFVVYGQVHGWAGTDHRRRDLSIALLWGTPVALAFGLLAAMGTTLTTMILAATGVWFGRWIDAIIQRITEIQLILPLLPILIMVGTFYSRSLWLMLGVVVVLGIFGSAVKTYRALFLQVKESPYIEAARAYGASSWRIIFQYMIPRVVPILVPQLVVLVPSYVFLEATLAVLGLGDPVLPTWGKIIDDARVNGALHQGQFYWVFEPAALLMLSGLSFAMVGFALDRIFNPRLRGL